jgi:3-hydroxyisobutyrate dehydrogenase-like beta-hydroxyacid dehydrogenase
MNEFNSLGFVGMGVMGEGMCANVLRKSKVTVYGTDLNIARLAPLAELGLKVQHTLEDVAANAELVFLSLPGGPEVEKVCGTLLDAPGQLKYVVDMSTAPPGLARSLANQFAALGVTFVDAPVARTRQAAREGTLSIMVGARKHDFDILLPYLKFMGTDVTLCGGVGAGQVVKIVNNMVVFMNVQALAEALVLGRASGVDGQTLFDVLALGSADSFMLRAAGMKSLVKNDFPLAAFPTEYAIKDIGYALDLAKENGLNLTGARATRALLTAARDAGYGKEYYPVFIKAIYKMRKSQ